MSGAEGILESDHSHYLAILRPKDFALAVQDFSKWHDIEHRSPVDKIIHCSLFSKAARVAPATTHVDWKTALNRCDALVYGGHSDWRLPTRMKLVQAYINGIRDLVYKGGTAGTASNNPYFAPSFGKSSFWAATTFHTTTQAPILGLEGMAYWYAKSDVASTMICVR